jgi:undecaprenyl-diphosphatase
VNDYLASVILGIVEGLTEFLPVSSTAHIRIAQGIMGQDLHDNFWKLFAVVIQLPAILAVVVFFWHRIVSLTRSFLARGLSNQQRLSHPVVLVLIATIVTLIPVAILKKIVKSNMESLLIIGAALTVGGVVMWAVDAYFGKREKEGLVKTTTMDQMSPLQAIWVGAVQILSAVFPGTSRSMSTIVGGQLAGMSRAAALEFSFFLSIPIMFAACAKDLKDSISPKSEDYIGHALTGHEWTLLAIGSVVSFFVAWAVIAWFMSWVRRRSFVPFAVYRIVVGIAVLAWAFSHRAGM